MPNPTSSRSPARAPSRPRPEIAASKEATVEEERATAVQPTSVWRLEYGLLALIAVLITILAFVFFFFDIDLAQLTTYGYIGLFVISLISAASIVLPMPGAAAITGAGAVLDPILGIPVPILVGLVAGVGEALGELTGYAAGYGGTPLFRDRAYYPRVKQWMERRGILTMFLLSSFPNPFVDIAGVAAGAVRMRLSDFFMGVLPGKVFKNVYLSAGGLAA
ncbi:MAG: VTT domain-containing protein, partial [Dehalococcoidia bacterium]|nr:VTT domain-containing protein [Dehalococcoidia bacterium]